MSFHLSLWPVSRAACGDPWKESGDVSDSGSSTTSGHWSGSSGISTPSPPHPQASPKYLGDAFGSPQTDHGFETDSDPFLLDEPAPRKRKVGDLGLASMWRWPSPEEQGLHGSQVWPVFLCCTSCEVPRRRLLPFPYRVFGGVYVCG